MESLPLCLQTHTYALCPCPGGPTSVPGWYLGPTCLPTNHNKTKLKEDRAKTQPPPRRGNKNNFSPQLHMRAFEPQCFSQLSLRKPDSSSRADALRFDRLYLGVCSRPPVGPNGTVRMAAHVRLQLAAPGASRMTRLQPWCSQWAEGVVLLRV